MTFDIDIRSRTHVLVQVKGFRIQEGGITLLFGESGIGKSLIGRSLFGVLNTEDLTARINGQDYASYVSRHETRVHRHNGFLVFQEPSTHLYPLLTLDEQLSEGDLRPGTAARESVRQLWSQSSPEQVRRLLEVYPKPYRPSGGEKQRILIAMALAKLDLVQKKGIPAEDCFFVFDEPTGSLDNEHRNLFLSLLLERFRHRQFTSLLITHDYSIISELTTRHRDLIPSITMKELVLRQGTHAVRDFHPATYLDWLKGQPPLASATPAPSRKTPIVQVESGMRVFGRNLSLFSGGSNSQEAPLRLFGGEVSYVKAPSGAGKTTLVKTMMGLVQAERFRMRLGTIDITHKTPRSFWYSHIWGKRMAMVFQHADEALNPRSTVRGSFEGLPLRGPGRHQRIEELMGMLFDDATADAIRDRQIRYLSGGQKQRVNLLRSLALDTEVLILDEPMNGLDFESFRTVLRLLERKLADGVGLLLISHNEEIFDRLIPEESRVLLLPR